MANTIPERFVIKNEQLTVEIKKLGAELCSVRNELGTEFIWQAEEVWPRHAPNLFPAVGSLLDHEYTYNGITYPLKHHGFARDMYFDMLHQSEHSIALVLQQTVDTLKMYPFKFTLIITYALADNMLSQTFRLINDDIVKIPVSFGAHPAFNTVPVTDFLIEFSEEENIKANMLDGPYISDNEIDVIKDKQIILTDNTFDNDALIFQGLNSKKVTLAGKTTNYKVEVDISDFPYLGIWAKPRANFVCIEPWQGLADYALHNKKIEDKKGVVWIASTQDISKSFTMKFTS